jgi:hypothetical protein
MLYAFLKANRPELIARCRAKVSKRGSPVVTASELTHGIPLFLDQLTEMLPGGLHAEVSHHPKPEGKSLAELRMEQGAIEHGRELLRHDFSIEQVVHDYGDLCQSITELASAQHAAIDTKEFGVLNIKLDNAIAGAVSEYARRHRTDESVSLASLSALVHELRNLHNSAIVAITAMRHGSVGFSGATGARLEESMARTGSLLDRAISLADAAGL